MLQIYMMFVKNANQIIPDSRIKNLFYIYLLSLAPFLIDVAINPCGDYCSLFGDIYRHSPNMRFYSIR